MTKKISMHDVKYLRDRTDAGMFDCKIALEASDGDINNAIKYLRQKGLASASKKSSRAAMEGLIESYIHVGSKIGILVELNCETDFVAKKKRFQRLAKNIAMQLAAYQSIEYINIDDIPDDIIEHERNIESSKEDLVNKPLDKKEQIIEGRLQKRLKELSLMNQPYMKNSDISVEELVKEHIALFKENIKVRRFNRFILGDGLG
uniref:Elongation factor Ts, mitochondrial n=1 Tax=Pleonosporium borreri TaxID=2575635 RepID=A0A4D6WZ41_9FLOR|nr:Translation elongation factor Ts [Pleonosporium borreri]